MNVFQAGRVSQSHSLLALHKQYRWTHSTYHLRSVLWTAIDVFNLVIRCKGKHKLAKQTAETHSGMTVRTPESKQVLRPTLGSARSKLCVKCGATSSKPRDLLIKLPSSGDSWGKVITASSRDNCTDTRGHCGKA